MRKSTAEPSGRANASSRPLAPRFLRDVRAIDAPSAAAAAAAAVPSTPSDVPPAPARRFVSTQSVAVARGEAAIDDNLQLLCTLFVNPKTDAYAPKVSSFVVKEGDKTYGEAALDLLDFAITPGRSVKRVLPLKLGKKTLATRLVVSVTATPLAEGVAPSEASSVASALDILERGDISEKEKNQKENAGGGELTQVVEVETEWRGERGDRDSESRESASASGSGTPPRARRPPRSLGGALDDLALATRPDQSVAFGSDKITGDALLDLSAQPASGPFAGHLSHVRDATQRMRLLVGRACKINVSAADYYGNPRSSGGDDVRGVLRAPDGEIGGNVRVSDHGDGTYGLEFTCTSQGAWTLRVMFNGRLANDSYELIVSYGPLTSRDLRASMTKKKGGRQQSVCGGDDELVVEGIEKRTGRVLTGGEAFAVRVVSPSAMSMSVPLRIKPGTQSASARITWPEVGAHAVTVALDGVPIDGCPIMVAVHPEKMRLGACQITGAGTHRCVSGERISFVIDAHDSRGNRLVSGGADVQMRTRVIGGADDGVVKEGSVLDYGNGAYECSYAIRQAGPYEVTITLDDETLTLQGICVPGRAVASQCVLLGDAVLEVEVGERGTFQIERRDAHGNQTPSRQSQLAIRCAAEGPGHIDAHVVDGAEGRASIVASATTSGRYFLHVTAGEQQTPIVGSPFELVAYPSSAAANSCVTTVYGASLASADSDVLTATAGDVVKLVVSPRDRDGNPTVFSPEAEASASARGGDKGWTKSDADDVIFENDAKSALSPATLQATFSRAGSYLLDARIGKDHLAGYPRMLQITPGPAHPLRCVLFGDALDGVDANATSTLTIHAADRHGNLLARGGDLVDMSLLSPDGVGTVSAVVVDHGDGTYGASFALDKAGVWGLSVSVNGVKGAGDVAEVVASFGPCFAHDVVFRGFGVDPGAPGTGGSGGSSSSSSFDATSVMTSSDVVVQASAYESLNRWMTGSEAVGVRVLTPSGGISAVDVTFREGRYHGSYRWTQAGLHTVSVSLDQEAVIGSPFTIDIVNALPELRELEDMSSSEVSAFLVRLQPEAASQALASMPPTRAAESLEGYSAESTTKMLNGMYPSAVSQVLNSLPRDHAAAAVEGMTEERTEAILASMDPADVGALLSNMSGDALREKSSAIARSMNKMNDADLGTLLSAMARSEEQGGAHADATAKILDGVATEKLSRAVDGMSTEEGAELLRRMNPDKAAAVIAQMDPMLQIEFMKTMDDYAVFALTKGLYKQYKEDKHLPAKERDAEKEAAVIRARRIGPALGRLHPEKLATAVSAHAAEDLGGTLYTLLSEPAGGHIRHAAAAAEAAAAAAPEPEPAKGKKGKKSKKKEKATPKPGAILDAQKLDETIAAMSMGARSAAAQLLRELPMEKQKEVAAELVDCCPKGVAGAIFADFSGHEMMRMMMHFTPEQLARALAELARESIEVVALLQESYKPSTRVGAALSVIVASLNATDGKFELTRPEKFAILKGAPGYVLKHVKPLRDLGICCVNHLTSEMTALVLSDLDVRSCAAAFEGLDPDQVRAIMEADRAEGELGQGHSHPNLIAACVRYMNNMSAKDAAGMLEAMPLDLATEICINTLDKRVEEIFGFIKNSKLRSRVASRATISLIASEVMFPEAMLGSDVASESIATENVDAAACGTEFAFKLVARERGGGRIRHGGAELTAYVSPPIGHPKADFGEPCVVTDNGDGEYDVRFTPTVSGTCRITLEVQSAELDRPESREILIEIEPGEPVATMTEYDATAIASAWSAGEPGVLDVFMRDAFGNVVHADKALFAFEGRAEGPGGVAIEPTVTADGVSRFEFTTTIAGIYSVSVVSPDTGEPLPGMPLDVVLRPGPVSHVGSTASLATETSAGDAAGARAATHGVTVAIAGEEITCHVSARDRHGNAAAWNGEKATAVARGSGGSGEFTFDAIDVGGGRAELRGVVPRAGSYLVAVAVDDLEIASSPIALVVYPGQCETSRASIRGDALAGVFRDAPAHVTVQTEDKFGNPCHVGGDQVDVSLTAPSGARLATIDVVDHDDGTYGCTFILDEVGRWIAQAVVNGRVAKESTSEIVATYGPLRPRDVALRPGPGLAAAFGGGGGSDVGVGSDWNAAVVCGAVNDVYVQSLEYEVTGRGMRGQEAISVHVVAPSGTSHAVPTSFTESGGRYRASVRWWEVGTHEIVATMNGESIAGSPLFVDVEALDASLPMSRLSGAGLETAIAGEPALALIESRDSRGNRLFEGGANFQVATRVGGVTTKGTVVDNGDGTYEASYVVTKAGPFEVSFFRGTETITFRATCEAGAVDYNACRVEGALRTRWQAGGTVALTVVRVDAYGNRVPRREGLARLAGGGRGPGAVAVDVSELGDGTCEIRFFATVAGSYQVGVFVEDEDTRAKRDSADQIYETEAELEEALLNGEIDAEGFDAYGDRRDGVSKVDDSLIDPVRLNRDLFGFRANTMFPLPNGIFELELGAADAEPTNVDVIVVGATRAGETWIVHAGDEIFVQIQARDRYGNRSFWEEDKHIEVEARGTEYVAFNVTGATGNREDYVARMIRSGTFELRVLADSLAVSWRALQVIAGPTHTPMCRLSVNLLETVRTGDRVELVLKTADMYGNLRLEGEDEVSIEVTGPNGVKARDARVLDNVDGTYGLEFVAPTAGRWNILVLVNGEPTVDGGIPFTVLFGRLTAEEASARLIPSIEDADGVYEIGSTAKLVIEGVGFRESGRLLTGGEAVTVRLLQPSGVQEAIPCAMTKDKQSYVADVQWLYPGRYGVSVMLDGEHVPGTPMYVTAEGLEVSLTSSTFGGRGAEFCVAGEEATVTCEARDYGGNRINRGGAPLLLEARTPDGEVILGKTVDYGDGTYEFTYTVTKAGQMEIAIILNKPDHPTTRTIPIPCHAGPMSPPDCDVDAAKMMARWVAGAPGAVRVARRDRFGNLTKNRGRLNRLGAEVEGPGPCDCENVELGDGSWEVRLRAATAGTYDVSVIAIKYPPNASDDPDDRAVVGSFQVTLEPGPTFPSACVARMALLTVDEETGETIEEPIGGKEEDLDTADADADDVDVAAPATIMAGDVVIVRVLPRDSFGNKTSWTGGERILAAARGPVEVGFEPIEDVGSFKSTLTAAGAYSVAALVGDCSCAGWPRLVRVVAGAPDPCKTTISGDGLGHCTTGVPVELLLQTHDAYGNPRAVGGDLVELFGAPANEGGRREAAVDDAGDGSYRAKIILEELTQYDLIVAINGLRCKDEAALARYFLSPTLGPLRSSECALRGAEDVVNLGDATTCVIQPTDAIRVMTGREAVVVSVSTPSGLTYNNRVRFNAETRRFESPAFWVEPGRHLVRATLNGVPLPDVPRLVRVRDANGWLEEEDTTEIVETAEVIDDEDSDGIGLLKGAELDVAQIAEVTSEDAEEDAAFEFGGGGLRPSRAAAQRAAKSLEGLDASQVAKAMEDMRPAAAAGVLNEMPMAERVGALSAMDPAAAAAAMCCMTTTEVTTTFRAMDKKTRLDVFANMPANARGALLSSMSAQEAHDLILRDLWNTDPDAAVESVAHMDPDAAARACLLMPPEFLERVLAVVDAKKTGGPLLRALQDLTPEGPKRSTLALVTLAERPMLEKVASHLAAMSQASVDELVGGEVGGTGPRLAKLVGSLCGGGGSIPAASSGIAGAVLPKMSAKLAGHILCLLGPGGSARALASVVELSGYNGAFGAAMAEELDETGWAPDAPETRADVQTDAVVDVFLSMAVVDDNSDAYPDQAVVVLAAMEYSLTARVLGNLPPSESAILASRMPDATVVGEILASMPTNKRAMMMVRMEFAAGSAACDAMEPKDVASAFAAVVETVLDEKTQTRAKTELKLRLVAIISEMDPFNAGAAMMEMDPLELAATLAGWLAPEKFAAIIASGSMDMTFVASVLDDMDADRADRVVAALPPAVAEVLLGLLKSGELVAMAKARGVVSLPLSTIAGTNASECVAGAEAKFSLISANPGGGRIERGGARVRFAIFEPERDDATPTATAMAMAPATAPDASRDASDDEEGFPVLEGHVATSQGGEMVDIGNGTYDATYALTRAGTYRVVLTTAGQEISFPIECVPTTLDPPSCEIIAPSEEDLEKWTAGSWLEVRVRRRDRFGNVTMLARGGGGGGASAGKRSKKRHGGGGGGGGGGDDGLVVFADGVGAGDVEAEVVEPTDAEVEENGVDFAVARFRATVAGEYELAIFAADAASDAYGSRALDLLPGSAALKSVALKPSVADAGKSTVRIHGLREKRGRVGGSTLVGDAGQEVTIAVEARDRFDNLAAFASSEGQRVRCDAVGPVDLTLDVTTSTSSELVFKGTLARAGSYRFKTTIDGRNVAGWPKALQIVAGVADAERCVVRGDALAHGVKVNERSRACFVAHDAHGNACLEGGDRVLARLFFVPTEEDPDDADDARHERRGGAPPPADADVVDHGDGTYGLEFSLPRPGTWSMYVNVNGESRDGAIATFAASQGNLTRTTMTLRLHEKALLGGPGGVPDAARLRVGAETKAYVQAIDFDAVGRAVGGREPVCLRLLTPSGVSAIVPIKLTKGGERFAGKVCWPEVGEHVLSATVDGEAVAGSPLRVRVAAADAHLPACKALGDGARACVAGVETQFVVEARDARGNRLTAGGASLTLRVESPVGGGGGGGGGGDDDDESESAIDSTQRGSVLDQGDGTYLASYAVDRAGPYALVVTSKLHPGARLRLLGSCAPGAVDVSRCHVDAGEMRRLVAGERGVARITRRDAHGNAVGPGPDLLPFRVDAASGPGPAEVDVVETGDGGAEIRFEAKIAGKYALRVYSGYARDRSAYRPFDVIVLPGQASASSCVAELEGTRAHGPGVVAAIAGESLTVRMRARDRFGNPTRWKRWQKLEVSAMGPADVGRVSFTETSPEGYVSEDDDDVGLNGNGAIVAVSSLATVGGGRGAFVATLERAGSYVISCAVGGQAVNGWPRVLRVVPGEVDADYSTWRADAETMAMTSELTIASASANAVGLGLDRRLVERDDREALALRKEADALRKRLAKYEEAAAVVMEAATLSGRSLKEHARDAAYIAEAKENVIDVSGGGEDGDRSPRRSVVDVGDGDDADDDATDASSPAASVSRGPPPPSSRRAIVEVQTETEDDEDDDGSSFTDASESSSQTRRRPWSIFGL